MMKIHADSGYIEPAIPKYMMLVYSLYPFKQEPPRQGKSKDPHRGGPGGNT